MKFILSKSLLSKIPLEVVNKNDNRNGHINYNTTLGFSWHEFFDDLSSSPWYDIGPVICLEP